MGILVQKYGGTSVGTIDRIKSVSRRIKLSIEQGHRVAIVVSAMAGVTNQLVSYVNSINSYEGDKEYDVVVSSGEQVAAGLIAISLKNLGLSARSYMAWQLPIITDANYGQANILEVCQDKLTKDLDLGVIPVICGFQGVSDLDDVTTIGRGGSDLTAVAVAAALKADMCEIYSDVDGVYTADPNKVSTARLINNLNYFEMLEFSLNGAKVLQAKSVDYAMKNNVKVRAASSFINSAGTTVSNERSMNSQIIGICSNSNLVYFIVDKYHFDKIEELLNKNYIRIVDIAKQSSDTYMVTINQNDMRSVCQISESVLGKKYRIVFQKSEFCSISTVGLEIGKNTEIIDIINTTLMRMKIRQQNVLNNSINITVSKKDELEILSMLHGTFIR